MRLEVQQTTAQHAGLAREAWCGLSLAVQTWLTTIIDLSPDIQSWSRGKIFGVGGLKTVYYCQLVQMALMISFFPTLSPRRDAFNWFYLLQRKTRKGRLLCTSFFEYGFPSLVLSLPRVLIPWFWSFSSIFIFLAACSLIPCHECPEFHTSTEVGDVVLR